MDKRFTSLFNLTEDQAISVLDTPPDQVSEEDSRYIAACHLVNFPTERSIQALIRAVHHTDPSLDNWIVRRKSVETLGRLKAQQALATIVECLQDDDQYTVENAAWAIEQIGTNNPKILETVAQLLDKPKQTYRVIIHTLAQLNYQPAIKRIEKFREAPDSPTASAAITAICRLTQDYTDMGKVVEILQHSEVLGRRLAIQDLMDAQYYDAIPAIAKTPVSLIFRLRGIRTLGKAGIAHGTLTYNDLQSPLEETLRDHPSSLNLVHCYDKFPTLPFLIRELYQTDFGRCYLASQTILEHYGDVAPAALFTTYQEEAHNDYGAHFHVIKLFGWLKHAPAYDLIVEALHNEQPQFQKSRAAAAIALGELNNSKAIPELKTCLNTKIWDLKYAALMALEQFGEVQSYETVTNNDDWLVQKKAEAISPPLLK